MQAQLLTTLENSRKYTLAVVEAMPANRYHSKPAEGIWNFGELMNHIAYGMEWWRENYLLKNKVSWNPPVMKNDRKTATENLEKAYSSLKKTIEKEKCTDRLVAGFQATLDHITHHRGQATVYLRFEGIEPPEYNF